MLKNINLINIDRFIFDQWSNTKFVPNSILVENYFVLIFNI